MRTSNKTEVECGSEGRQMALGQRLNVCYVTPASASVVLSAHRGDFFVLLDITSQFWMRYIPLDIIFNIHI